MGEYAKRDSTEILFDVQQERPFGSQKLEPIVQVNVPRVKQKP